MHAGAGGRRRDAKAEHHGGPGKAVGHADGTVHQLGREAHRDEKNKIPRHCPPPWWQPSRAALSVTCRFGARYSRRLVEPLRRQRLTDAWPVSSGRSAVDPTPDLGERLEHSNYSVARLRCLMEPLKCQRLATGQPASACPRERSQKPCEGREGRPGGRRRAGDATGDAEFGQLSVGNRTDIDRFSGAPRQEAAAFCNSDGSFCDRGDAREQRIPETVKDRFRNRVLASSGTGRSVFAADRRARGRVGRGSEKPLTATARDGIKFAGATTERR
jgi:hypothetical protein